MRDFRLTGLAVLSVVAAAVVAFLLAYLAGQNRTAPPRQQAGASSPAGADKDNAAASAKSTARILAPTTVNYYRVKVALDSTLRTDKHTFHLYAADVPGREGTCTYRDGRRWACGLRAYVALLNLVGSDPIECHPANADKPDIVICHRGNTDLSEWMLAHGWARLQAGVTEERYRKAAAAAKTAKIGMWIEAPPSPQNATAH